jgi:hypothetical protein
MLLASLEHVKVGASSRRAGQVKGPRTPTERLGITFDDRNRGGDNRSGYGRLMIEVFPVVGSLGS